VNDGFTSEPLLRREKARFDCFRRRVNSLFERFRRKDRMRRAFALFRRHCTGTELTAQQRD
jgi:hypothetical protein